MKIFIDSANLDEIREAQKMGLLDGVTTNPSLIAKTGKTQKEVTFEICKIVSGPISAEVISTHYEGMMEEALQFANWGPQIVIKLPLTENGLKAARSLKEKGIKTNVTLCFSPLQALLAAKAGATYISPFVGRLDDIASDGMELIRQIVKIYQNYKLETQVLVASVRHPIHIVQAAEIGAHVVTVPFAVLQRLIQHPLTESGLAKFLEDHRKSTHV